MTPRAMPPGQWWHHGKVLRAGRHADRPWVAPWLMRYGTTYSRRPLAVLAGSRRCWTLPNGDRYWGGTWTVEEVRLAAAWAARLRALFAQEEEA